MPNEKICVYFTADLYGQTVELKVDAGEFKPRKEIPYAELIKTIEPEKLALIMPDGTVDPKSIKIITPEEYDRDYGDDEEGDEDAD